MRALVRIEALVTQLVFEHALRMRVKAETGAPAANGEAREGRNVQGKVNNLITSDLAAIGFGREILAPCPYTLAMHLHRSLKRMISPEVASFARWMYSLSVRAPRLEVSAPVGSFVARTQTIVRCQCSSGHERSRHPAPSARRPSNPSSQSASREDEEGW